MSRTIANVTTTSDTFYSWLGKTNQHSEAFLDTVTVKANTAGDLTTGNGFVVGIFGANTITGSTIRGGSVTTAAALTISSNTKLGNSSSQITVSHNDLGYVKTASYTSTNTDDQILDSFAVSDYRSGKYLISMKNTNNNDYQVTEIMVLHDGTNAYTTEYATLVSSATLAQLSANISGSTVRLFVKPSLADNVIKYQRTTIAV